MTSDSLKLRPFTAHQIFLHLFFCGEPSLWCWEPFLMMA